MKPIRAIKRIVRKRAIRRAKQARHPLIVSREGRPTFVTKFYTNLSGAGHIFGKKLKPGFNRVGEKDVFVRVFKDRVAVSPIVHRHGLWRGIGALDHIEKERKISESGGPHVTPGWGTRKATEPIGRIIPDYVFESFTGVVRERGPFFRDRIQVVFIPEKSESKSPHVDARSEDLPASNLATVQIFCERGASQMTKKEKLKAYQKRFPWLAEHVGFEILFIRPVPGKDPISYVD